jgi:hypothetical protein
MGLAEEKSSYTERQMGRRLSPSTIEKTTIRSSTIIKDAPSVPLIYCGCLPQGVVGDLDLVYLQARSHHEEEKENAPLEQLRCEAWSLVLYSSTNNFMFSSCGL